MADKSFAEGTVSLLDDSVSTLRKNEDFCRTNKEAAHTLSEILALGNNALEHLIWVTQPKDWGDRLVRSCMVNYIFFILRPLPDGILLNYYAANIPACFMQLRTLLEQLAKCVYADERYPTLPAYWQRMTAVETERLSPTKIIKFLGNEAVSLWSQLSNDWVHMRAFERLVRTMAEHGVPAYTLAIPNLYAPTDVPDIEELGTSISRFRRISAATIERWKGQQAPPQLSEPAR